MNASLSFDIRVTAADNVTSNLYRFVYGKRNSTYNYFVLGSSFDMEQTIKDPNSDLETQTSASSAYYSEGSCEQCPLGTFSVGIDSEQCSLCRPGYYTEHFAMCQCKPCPLGTFTYTWGSKSCR